MIDQEHVNEMKYENLEQKKRKFIVEKITEVRTKSGVQLIVSIKAFLDPKCVFK